MVATWCPAASSVYYTRQTEYFLANGQSVGHWFCPTGQFEINDKSIVLPREFEQLFSGNSMSGEPLMPGARTDRIPAFDVTCSAPRSVSILWAFSNPETRQAIELAQSRAARAALEMLETEAAYARRGRGGMRVEKVALSAACFQHRESRPAKHMDGRIFADMNLHDHSVILNLAVRADNTVGAIHSTVLRDWKMSAGAFYHAALAIEMEGLGFGIDRIGKNGIFEIAGIDDATIQYFSARRQEIESELADAGTTSAQSSALAAAVAASTRSSKLDYNTTDQTAKWREAAASNGIDADQIEKSARDVAMSMGKRPQSLVQSEWLAALPRVLTESQSVIERRELLRVAAATAVGSGLHPNQIAISVDQLIVSGEVVTLGTDAIGQPMYSTPDMIRIERDVVATASRLACMSWQAISPETIQRHCKQQNLNTQQTTAAEIATTASRIAIIEGAPGSGKTTTLAPIVAAYRAAGCRVLGSATAWRIANMLQNDLQIESRAVASWLEQIRIGVAPFDRKTLLIVDEAALLNSRDMHKLLTAVESSGAKLLLVGDRDQLQAIGGPGLSLVARAVEQAKVSTIVRQKEAWVREAITSFGKGDSAQALASFAEHGLLIESENARATVGAVVDHWQQSQRSNRNATQLIIAKTNAEVTAIGREVRSRLQALGVVHGPSIAIQSVTPSGHTTEITLAAGDRIRFLGRNDMLGVVNGTTGIVVQVSENAKDQEKGLRIIADVDGRRIAFSPNDFADTKGRARLGWAYASTVYGSQGLTVDHAVVLVSQSFDRHDIYVAASRARHAPILVIDKSGLDLQIQNTRDLSDSSHVTDLVTSVERRTCLANFISRSMPKQSTLDLADFERRKLESVQQDLKREISNEVTLEY